MRAACDPRPAALQVVSDSLTQVKISANSSDHHDPRPLEPGAEVALDGRSLELVQLPVKNSFRVLELHALVALDGNKCAVLHCSCHVVMLAAVWKFLNDEV
jgi:hypothetical protein